MGLGEALACRHDVGRRSVAPAACGAVDAWQLLGAADEEIGCANRRARVEPLLVEGDALAPPRAVGVEEAHREGVAEGPGARNVDFGYLALVFGEFRFEFRLSSYRRVVTHMMGWVNA